MDVGIRQATADDMELLMKWRMEVLHEVFAIPENHPTEKLEAENSKYYERALRTEEHIACFAWVENQIVGCGGICLYQEMPSPDNPDGRCAYLMNIYTRPEVRKQGIGEAIITWLVSRASDLGISKIYLETSKAGKSLYTKMGFAPMPDMMKYC